MLKHAKLNQKVQNKIISRASGDYNVHRILSAFRSVYSYKTLSSSSHAAQPGCTTSNVFKSPVPTSRPDYYLPKQSVQLQITTQIRNLESSCVVSKSISHKNFNKRRRHQHRLQNSNHLSFFQFQLADCRLLLYNSPPSPSLVIFYFGAYASVFGKDTLN